MSPDRKRITHVVTAREKHWVGDGFHVSTIFSPHQVDPQVLSPFILMDHAAPKEFAPSARPRGVGEHPHRGFETVTFAYKGEVAHRDSHGGGGTIGAGDVQWMTAASGVVHEEFHSKNFTESGGIFEMVQLWVNLPARLKMKSPQYQMLLGTSFPKLRLGEADARLIAGSLEGAIGPAQTNTPITMFDGVLTSGRTSEFHLDEGATVLLFLLEGKLSVQGEREVDEGSLVIFDRASKGAVHLEARSDVRFLVLSGEPLNEPVVAHGPFVMNTKREIIEAIHDFQNGKMGQLPLEVAQG